MKFVQNIKNKNRPAEEVYQNRPSQITCDNWNTLVNLLENSNSGRFHKADRNFKRWSVAPQSGGRWHHLIAEYKNGSFYVVGHLDEIPEELPKWLPSLSVEKVSLWTKIKTFFKRLIWNE
jgi:hypothetical protein